jgi:RimJ/RimL family protein N-acetyltransferase
MKILETERLILRHFEEEDIEEVYRLLYADEEVKNAWSGRKGTVEEIKESFKKDHFYPKDEFGLRALILKPMII